jgi:hypothetical protein
MSFPIASALCTRFATQIVLCCAHQDDAGARITIIPGPGTPLDDELDNRLRSFQRTLAVDQFESEEFGRIFDEVGISSPAPYLLLTMAQGGGIHGPTWSQYKRRRKYQQEVLG